MTASLAYRTHEDAIKKGVAPDKYLRLLPYISGSRILEIGAAEGVLSLLLAERGHSVTALEKHSGRHSAALHLQDQWRRLGRSVDGCTMIQGSILDRFDLLDGVDTFVAVRTIYHLQDRVHDVFTVVAAAGVSSVVLCGNPNRALWPKGSSSSVAKLGQWNRYASVAGMSEVLTRAGYTVGTVIAEGDPIVTGHR